MVKDVFWRNWRETLKSKPKEPSVTIDHKTQKVISIRKIEEEKNEIWLKIMMAMAKRSAGV